MENRDLGREDESNPLVDQEVDPGEILDAVPRLDQMLRINPQAIADKINWAFGEAGVDSHRAKVREGEVVIVEHTTLTVQSVRHKTKVENI